MGNDYSPESFVSERIADRLRESAKGSSKDPSLEIEAAGAIDRLLVLLSHAVKEADEWHDDSRGGPIEGDPLMYEARSLVMMVDHRKRQ